MSKKIFVRHQQMKNDTLTETLRSINRGASCKRDVQSSTGLSWGAVSETVNLLLEKQIINFCEEIGKVPAGAGRRSSHFEFSRTGFLCIGMELQRRQISTTLINMGGRILGRNIKVLDGELTAATLQQYVLAAFDAQLNQSQIAAEKVIALSFSLTGAVDSFNKIWLQSSHVPEIRNYDFGKLAVDFPNLYHLSVEHDIFAKARAVLADKNWQDDNFVFMHIGGGVGMAIHNQNGFFFGSRGLAGEIGHIPVMNAPAGSKSRRCSCGQNNCLEIFLSDHGLLAFAGKKFNIKADNLPALFAAATTGQMNEFYRYLHPYLLQTGITAANLFDPATIIIGGELIEPWLPQLQERLLPELQAAGWIHSPAQLKCYSMSSCNSAFGTVLNSIEPVISLLAEKFQNSVL